MKLGRLSVLAMAVLGVGLTSGCNTQVLSSAGFLTTDALGIFRDEDVNMKQKSYAAADYLIQQARTFIRIDDDLVKAVILVDEDESRVQATIGRVIPENVGVRLSQLGYRMDLSEVSQGGDVNYLKPSARRNETPDFILGGSYVRKPQELDVSLRITETATGRIVAVFDYIMPMNREIAKMSEPETRIFQVTE